MPITAENVLHDLRVAYQVREIEPYAKLLAPEFRFQFQPLDANEFGQASWTRDTTYNTPGTPLDTLRVFVSWANLQVDQTDGFTWIAADQQELFFRQGIADAGEDPTRWFLYEWRDLPAGFFQNRGLDSPQGAVISATTWGKLKVLYAN